MRNERKKSISIHLLKPVEVSRVLNVSKSTVYRMLKSGDLPSLEVGFSKRVHPDDLDHFIEECRKPLAAQID